MKKRRQARAPQTARSLPDRLALGALFVLLLLPPLVFDPLAKDNFRLPKAALTETLALLSLVFLAFRLRAVERIDARRVLGHPAVLTALPLLAVVTLGFALTDHPLHVRAAWPSFAITAAAFVGWSWALRAEERRRLLRATIFPATLLALLAIAQAHDLFDPFRFEGQVSERRGLTSLAGGALDLASYLVLPALIAQIGVARARSRGRRVLWAGALAVAVYAMARTQTLTALAAFVASSLVLWAFLVPVRRLAAGAALSAVVAGALVVGVEPLRKRVVKQAERLRAGELNELLTGRLDGWRAAVWMLREHPALGVGLGAYTTEFAAAKLQLAEEGVRFFHGHVDPHFASAHNEYLEVVAENGFLGLLALAWGIGTLGRRLGRAPPREKAQEEGSEAREGRRDEAALGTAGATALGVLALASFPMHLSIVAYPYVLLLGGVTARRDEEVATA